MLFYRIYFKGFGGEFHDAFNLGIIEHDLDFESIEQAGKYLDENYHPDPDLKFEREFAILAMWA